MIYLIDFENVHEEGFSALGRLGDKDAVYCFFTRNVAKISMSALAGMRSGQLHFIEAESGKQSLDLALVSYLGYLIGTRPQELYYDIVSNDNGFAKVAEFWNKRGNGLRVRVRKTNDLKPKAETVKPQPANTSRRAPAPAAQKPAEQPAAEPEMDTAAVFTAAAAVEAGEQPAEAVTAAAEGKQEPSKQKQPRQRGQRQRSQRQRGARPEPARVEEKKPEEEKTEAQEPVEQPKPKAKPAPAVEDAAAQKAEPKPEARLEAKPVPEAKSSESAAASASQTAGIPAEAEEFIRAQAEKYREDKNRKQLVYRAVVKKFGQKNGTQIYNNAKKLLLK